MTGFQRIIPLSVAILAVLWLGGQAYDATSSDLEEGFDLDAFGRIPVTADGRVKPLDTVARTNLMLVSGRQTFELEGEQKPAIRWFADVIARGGEARQYPVFRVDHPEVLSMLDVDEPGPQSLALQDIMPHVSEILEQADRAADRHQRERSPFHRQVLHLHRQVGVVSETVGLQAPYMVPPLEVDGEWQPLYRAMHDAEATGQWHPVVVHLREMISAYAADDPERFNEEVSAYLGTFEQSMPATVQAAEFEVFFNRFAPFYKATALYIGVLLLAMGSLLLRSHWPQTWSRLFASTAFWLLVITFLLHTFGIIARIYLQGRPPVTNLYSSAVFAGWGTVLLALILEPIYRNGIASVAAAMVGFVTLIIAHNLAGDGDTMEMMQAVLDSNFWLATHVIVITLGYSATFVAGALGILFIVMGVFTSRLSPDLQQSIQRMVYGTICFALLFSFTGTVLGGIWADQSWGRFWGWDPKENGAAMLVLAHALILHARWGGMIQARGIMVLAVMANIITAWAWFGTNLLGVGLHSYGFTDSGQFWLMGFVFSQLLLMGLGVLPVEAWRSPIGGRRTGSTRTGPPSPPAEGGR